MMPHHINYTVIIMNETQRKLSPRPKEKKKDRYTAVLLSQIISAVILLLIFNFTVKSNTESYTLLKEILAREIFTVGDIVESVKNYFTAENTWAVSGDNLTVIDDTAAHPTGETTAHSKETEFAITENLTGTGGDDLEIYEAAANTSFAPVKVTSLATAPIEKGRYTSYFGYRINPVTGKFSFHTGLDIAAPEGTKIRAAYSGRVTKVGEDERAGKYIFLTHDDGFVTFYCHCSEILAEYGAKIRQGETIARVGSTGRSTGPHLHFEIRKDNIRYNPLHILSDDSDS